MGITRNRNLSGLLAAGSVAALLSLAGPASAAVIEGTVTEKTRTVALEGAIVRIVETGQTAVSGRDGGFRFPNVPAGAYTLEISYLGAEPVTVSVSANDAAPSSVAILLGEDVPVLENVLVIGQRGGQASALSQQRAADNLTSILSADAVGNFPDQNVSESARRIVGLSVENDQGEGRYVVIRGIDPNLNATTVNGVSLPSPEGDGRQVQLDVIDSDLLDGIEVTKSLTPDMDGDAIGGTIEIKTLSAFDRDGTFVKLKGAGSYNDLTGEWSPKLSARGSAIFEGDRFGVAGSISWFDREFATENKEVDGTWDNDTADDGDIFFPEEVELRDYVVNRERLSGALNFDFRPTADNRFYLRTLYSEFEDQEYRSRMEAKLADDNFAGDPDESSAAAKTALFDSGDEDIDFEKDIKDRLETATIYSIQVGGESFLDSWTIDYSVSFSHAEEDEPNAIDTATFQMRFDDGSLFGVNVADPFDPILVYPDPADLNAVLNDAASYEFEDLELVNQKTEDEEWAFAFNAQYDTFFGSNPGYIKAGAKVRLREKNRDEDGQLFEWDGPADLFMTDFATTVDYPLDRLGLVPSAAAVRAFFFQNFSDFKLDDFETEILMNAGDFEAQEDIYAGYLMGRVDINSVRFVGGVRVEHTQFDASANEVLAADEDALVNGVELTEDTVFVTPTALSEDYTDFLPSLNVRWEIRENLIGRAAYYASISRPKFEAIIPAAELEQNDDDEYEGSFGNPDLDRQQAQNFDISLEWYPTRNSVVQGGIFYKDIKDFVAVEIFEDYDFNGITFEEAETFVNLDDASLLGFEFNVQQAADFLPAPFDGLIYGFNYTYVDGEATTVAGRDVPLPKQSERIANAVLGYEKGRFSVRAALSHRSEYLDELDGTTDGNDRFVDEHTQLDIKGSIDITDRIKLFAEVNNVTDEPFTAYFDQDGGKFLSQYEEYGYTAQFGLSITN